MLLAPVNQRRNRPVVNVIEAPSHQREALISQIVVIARQPARQIIGGVQMRQDGPLKTGELVWFRHALISPFAFLPW